MTFPGILKGMNPTLFLNPGYIGTPSPSNNHGVTSCNSKTKNLTIMYYNVRNLLSQINELRLIAEANSPSSICVVEILLCCDILDAELFVCNYSIVHLDRSHNGGGILMFISANLKFSVLSLCDGLELLSVLLSNEVCKSCITLSQASQLLKPFIIKYYFLIY